MKHNWTSFLSTVFIAGLASLVNAEVVNTSVGKISLVEVGWNGEGINILHSGAITGCNSNPQEFALSKDHAGYKELVSLILAAHASSANVQLVVDKGNCLFGNRTKIVTVRLLK